MAKVREPVKAARTLASVRASLGRVRTQGERIVARLRRDAEALMARSRGEVMKEVRDLERRVLKALHGATQERVARLEGRITKLEATVAELERRGGTGGEKAA